MAEAERDGDTGVYERLMLERRLLNEQRRSLDKRRDQTRLLARSAVPSRDEPAIRHTMQPTTTAITRTASPHVPTRRRSR